MILSKKLIAVLLLVLLTTSCSQSVYRAKAAIPVAQFSAPLVADLESPTLIRDYDAMPEGAAKIARRNQILWEYTWLVDNSYGAYEAGFFSGQAFVSTAGDFLNLALDTTGAVTGTAHLKSILAAASGAVTGARASYQKNFFDQATRESIVQVMRANRLTELVEIQTGMASPNYTLEQGLMDVASYYDAGSVIGALVSISNSSAANATAAREAMRQLRLVHR
jgi:hypothetical protein